MVLAVVLGTIIFCTLIGILLWNILDDDNDNIGSNNGGGMMNVAISGMNIACFY